MCLSELPMIESIPVIMSSRKEIKRQQNIQMQNRAKLSGIAINTTPFEDHMHGAMFLKKVDLKENRERLIKQLNRVPQRP